MSVFHFINKDQKASWVFIGLFLNNHNNLMSFCNEQALRNEDETYTRLVFLSLLFNNIKTRRFSSAITSESCNNRKMDTWHEVQGRRVEPFLLGGDNTGEGERQSATAVSWFLMSQCSVWKSSAWAAKLFFLQWIMFFFFFKMRLEPYLFIFQKG